MFVNLISPCLLTFRWKRTVLRMEEEEEEEEGGKAEAEADSSNT